MAAPYYVTHNAGGGGVGTEGDPFTLVEACDAVAAGETVYVKASGAYNVQDGANDCVFNLSTAGEDGAPILWQGYHTTINDGGIVEIDADTNSLANALLCSDGTIHYQAFKNFEFWGASSHGANLNGSDYCTFKNCSSHNNGGAGFSGDNNEKFENCIAYTNSASAFDVDSLGVFVSCVAHGGTFGFEINSGIGYGSLSYNNSDDGFTFKLITGTIFGCLGCTLDGEGTEIAIDVSSATESLGLIAFNNIFRDNTTPINCQTDSGELVIIGRNLYDAKDGDNANCLPVSIGDGIGDRGDVDGTDANLFNNEAGDDYSLKVGSTALVKGLDAHYTVAFWADYNEGAGDNPPAE